MEKQVTFFFDTIGNTFCLWLDDPKKETHADMNDYGDILMKDAKNRVVGFEKLNFLPQEFLDRLRLPAHRARGSLLLKKV